MFFVVVALALAVAADASLILPQPVVPAAVYGVPNEQAEIVTKVEDKTEILPAVTYGLPLKPTIKTEYGYTLPLHTAIPEPVYGLPAPFPTAYKAYAPYSLPTKAAVVYGLPEEKAPVVPAPIYGVPAPVVPAPTYGLPAPVVPTPTYGLPAPVVPAPTYGLPAPGVPVLDGHHVSTLSRVSPIHFPVTDFQSLSPISAYATSQILSSQFYGLPAPVVPQSVYGVPNVVSKHIVEPFVTKYEYNIPNTVIKPVEHVYEAPEVVVPELPKPVVPHTTYGLPL